MAVETESAITAFEQWYQTYHVNPHDGSLEHSGAFSQGCDDLFRRFDYYKREMEARVANYYKYEKQASAEVVSEKPNLPNVSSGDSAGFIERIAKNIVQHTPNVEIVSKFDDDSIPGKLARYFLTHKIIGDDEYSNDFHQNLLSSVERALPLGFDCVIPVLMQQASGSWYIQYDNIHYRDVFPEAGAKDVRRAHEVFIRRYMTKRDLKAIINDQTPGWDVAALRRMLKTEPSSRQYVDKESEKHHVNPQAYEVITWYNDSGDPFLTFEPATRMLLRIEKNKHPLKEHPVFFLVIKKDALQPLGKSVLAKSFGRQEFQDLFLNGAMKMWARNIDPPIFGYGTVNAIPNLSPGKYTQISNPNAKVEAFEVNTQALMMFNQIATANAGNISQLLGASDQQMASLSTGGMMSQTPQGVEAQQQLVDTNTNSGQKAVEAFVSRYLGYALTIYFQELKSITRLTPDATARIALENAGIAPEAFDEKGAITTPLSELAVQYWVKIVPGTLVEMEDEKQIRILNQMFVALSQAMPAIAASGDQAMIARASAVMQYIIMKQIELSGSDSSSQLKQLFQNGATSEFTNLEQRHNDLEDLIGGRFSEAALGAETTQSLLLQMQDQIRLLTQGQAALGRAVGLPVPEGAPGAPEPGAVPAPGGQPVTPGAPAPESAGAGQAGPPARV